MRALRVWIRDSKASRNRSGAPIGEPLWKDCANSVHFPFGQSLHRLSVHQSSPHPSPRQGLGCKRYRADGFFVRAGGRSEAVEGHSVAGGITFFTVYEASGVVDSTEDTDAQPAFIPSTTAAP